MYLINCKRTLENILITQKGFNILVQYIKDYPGDKLSLYAVNGFTMMAMNLKITMPQDNVPAIRVFSDLDWTNLLAADSPSWVETIRFVVSDNTEVSFDKALLIRLSEVFRTMFNSSFKEANDQKVELRYISQSALKYFLTILCEESQDVCPESPLTSSMEDLLQAYQLSRLYLLESIEKKVFRLIVNGIDSTNVFLVTRWSLEHLDEGLFDSATTYYISSDVEAHQKLGMFKRANGAQFREQWLERLREVIMYYCNE